MFAVDNWGQARAVRHRKIMSRFNLIAKSAIPRLPLQRHAGEHGHAGIDVVLDDYGAFGVVLTVQSADVLGERALPRDRHGEEQGIE